MLFIICQLSNYAKRFLLGENIFKEAVHSLVKRTL